MSDQNDTDDSTEPEYVAVGSHAWGRGRFETDAVENMVSNLPERAKTGDTVGFTLFKVKGFDGVGTMRGEVHADEVLSREVLEADADDVRELSDLLTDVAIAAEEVLVNAEEKDGDE